jgi:hypothetical protein
VVHVCAEHKKPAKLLKHLGAIKAAAAGLRNPPRVLVFANKIKVRSNTKILTRETPCVHVVCVCMSHQLHAYAAQWQAMQ